jgi:hypothetical protein
MRRSNTNGSSNNSLHIVNGGEGGIRTVDCGSQSFSQTRPGPIETDALSVKVEFCTEHVGPVHASRLEAVCLAISLGIGTLKGLVERTLGKRIFGADGGGLIVVHQSGRGKSEPAPVRIDRSWSVAATSGRRKCQILTTRQVALRGSAPIIATPRGCPRDTQGQDRSIRPEARVGNPDWFGPPHNVAFSRSVFQEAHFSQLGDSDAGSCARHVG